MLPSNAITPLHSTFWREGHETDFTNQLATGASGGVHHRIGVGAIRDDPDEGSGQLAENAASHAYHGTATAVEDTALTAKVKTALHDDAATKDATIHVTTVAGVVTLRGRVASGELSDKAQAIAQNTSGVKSVKNKLRFPK